MLALEERNQFGKLLLLMTLDGVGVARKWGQPQQLIIRQRPLLVFNAKPFGVRIEFTSHVFACPRARKNRQIRPQVLTRLGEMDSMLHIQGKATPTAIAQTTMNTKKAKKTIKLMLT